MIIGVNINHSAHLVKVFYDSETVRTFHGRVPFTALAFVLRPLVWRDVESGGWEIYREYSYDNSLHRFVAKGGVNNG